MDLAHPFVPGRAVLTDVTRDLDHQRVDAALPDRQPVAVVDGHSCDVTHARARGEIALVLRCRISVQDCRVLADDRGRSARSGDLRLDRRDAGERGTALPDVSKVVDGFLADVGDRAADRHHIATGAGHHRRGDRGDRRAQIADVWVVGIDRDSSRCSARGRCGVGAGRWRLRCRSADSSGAEHKCGDHQWSEEGEDQGRRGSRGSSPTPVRGSVVLSPLLAGPHALSASNWAARSASLRSPAYASLTGIWSIGTQATSVTSTSASDNSPATAIIRKWWTRL